MAFSHLPFQTLILSLFLLSVEGLLALMARLFLWRLSVSLEREKLFAITMLFLSARDQPFVVGVYTAAAPTTATTATSTGASLDYTQVLVYFRIFYRYFCFRLHVEMTKA